MVTTATLPPHAADTRGSLSSVSSVARAAPLRASDVSGVAPALILTAEYDTLRDEGEVYAERLAAAGVEVEHRRYPGQIHCFYRMGAVTDGAWVCLDDCAAALCGAFAG